ncbi:MAG: DUF1080 domain-containing protein, partial [Opitutales bacterium]|nr:DUF1080 domain-containing protein [Opitutales bacterium]
MLKRIIVGLFLVVTASAQINQVSEDQTYFIQKYEHQKCILSPEDMLINTDPEPAVDDGFTDLYNGNNLDGWTARGGRCIFRAKGEAIEGVCVPGSPSTYLCTDKADFKDFIFTVEVKWSVNGNSGVMFRSKAKPSVILWENPDGCRHPTKTNPV